jgi:hypothetical protein
MKAGLRHRRLGRGVLLLMVTALLASQAMVHAYDDGSARSSDRQPQGGRLQGQVPLEDQESGRSLRPYADNMRLVGQNDINNRGMNGNLGWMDDCAYVSAYFGADHPLAGLATLDVSNPRRPELVEIQPGTPGTRESQVEANEARRMVIVMPFEANTIFGDSGGPNQLQIYKADEDDCRQLTRVGTYEFGDTSIHEHRISEDGNTVYAVQNGVDQEGDAVQVIDVSDMANPTLLTTWDWTHEGGLQRNASHDLDLNADGTRGYFSARFRDEAGVRNGLWIIDTSEVAERRPNPTLHLISQFNYGPPESFTNAHTAQLAHIQDRTYIITMDETFNTVGCPWGWARIIDVTNERYPLQISTIRLDVQMRRHCDVSTRDNAMYSSHYIGVDDVNDTSMVFMTWYSSGLRVFDIRDPYDPVEIGSYIPGAKTDTEFVDTSMTRFGNNRVPYAYSFVRYRPETGHIWFTDVYNGLVIVELKRNTARHPMP